MKYWPLCTMVYFIIVKSGTHTIHTLTSSYTNAFTISLHFQVDLFMTIALTRVILALFYYLLSEHTLWRRCTFLISVSVSNWVYFYWLLSVWSSTLRFNCKNILSLVDCLYLDRDQIHKHPTLALDSRSISITFTV